MARRKLTEAERLRQHNEEMRLALAENVTVLEARQRLAARRWREFEAEMERRRRCGTAASCDLPSDAFVDEAPRHLQLGDRAHERPPFWWERD